MELKTEIEMLELDQRKNKMTDEVQEIAVRAVRLYAESHPRPPHVTQKQAAEMLYLSSKTVSKLVSSGAIKLNGAGLIPVSEIDRIIAAR